MLFPKNAKIDSIFRSQPLRIGLVFLLMLFLFSYVSRIWWSLSVHYLGVAMSYVGSLVFSVLDLFGSNISFSHESLESSVKSNHFYSIISLKHYVVLLMLYASFFSKSKKAFYYFIASITTVFLLSVFMLIFNVSLSGQLQYGAMIAFSDLRYVVLIAFFVFMLKNNNTLHLFFSKLYENANQYLGISLSWLVVLLFLVRGLKNIIEFYLFKTGSFDLLISAEVYLTSSILKLMGYSAQIYENTIFIGPYWVSIIEPCLGLGLMIVFSLLIGLVKSNWLNKIVYIVIGEVVIVVLNSFRIAMLLLKVQAMNGSKKINLEVHASAGYLFYVLVFVLFLIYLLWFHNLDLKKFVFVLRNKMHFRSN